MPISYPELEDVLIEWKKLLNVKKPIGGKSAQWVYNNMKETAQDRYIKKITSLFKKMDIDNLKVVETDPGFKGDTATGGSKPATLETGAIVRVPLFIEVNELLKIDTRSGEYISRVKDL